MNESLITYGSTLPAGYRPRIIDECIQRSLAVFGAVEIRGPKWCGKTWSALAFGESSVRVDEESMKALISSDVSLALNGATPRVIDEWQEVPIIWDSVRHAVDDAAGRRGLYLLTGSSTPAKDRVSHSGAGRIARLNMTTMTLWEQGISSGTVSLKELFEGNFSQTQESCLGLAQMADCICRGGWPANLDMPLTAAMQSTEQYLDALFEVSVPQKKGTPQTARQVALSLARNLASSATLKTIAADATHEVGGKDRTTSEGTVRSYLNLFRDLFLIEELPGWDAPIRSKSRVQLRPKRYFADPSIPGALLGLAPERLLTDSQYYGLLFESLCVHDIKASLLALPGSYPGSLRYYRDADGLEVDLIIELRDGRWAGIEIKLGEDKVEDGIAHLVRLRNKVAANPAARNPQPVFMAVITANSPFARYDRKHDVYVFPITALRP